MTDHYKGVCRLSLLLTVWLLVGSGTSKVLAQSRPLGQPASGSLHQAVTSDGRFNGVCRPWLGGEGKRLCEVSFYKLIANPERYDGSLVQFHGVIGKALGDQVVFPSEESRRNAVFVEAIALKPGERGGLILKGIASGPLDGAAVTVVGEFDADYGGTGESAVSLLGAIRGVIVLSAPARSH